MGNRYYEMYQKHCQELEELTAQYRPKEGNEDKASKIAKKLKGAVAAELLRQEIAEQLSNAGKPFKVSNMNVYIWGSKYEYDLLVVKKDAQPYMGLVYRPEDVVSTIECKAGGLFNLEEDSDRIARAANDAKEVNPDIRFGYITISENTPKNPVHNGTLTVNHWEQTKALLSKKVNGETCYYAVTLYQGKRDNICDKGNDSEMEDFIQFLIGQ